MELTAPHIRNLRRSGGNGMKIFWRMMAAALLGLALLSASAEARSVLTLPASLSVIEEEAFMGLQSVGEVVVPDGVKEIHSRAFADSSVEVINLPASVSYIADDAFEGCDSIVVKVRTGSYGHDWCERNDVSVQLPYTPAEYFTFTNVNGGKAVSGYNGPDTVVVIPDTVGGVPVVELASYAMDKTRITELILPPTVKTIGTCAFADCTRLKSVSFSEGLMIIRDYAFENCSALTEISLPASLQTIGSNIFRGCSSVVRFEIAAGSRYFKTVDDVLYSADGRTLVLYPCWKKDRSFSVPDGVAVIESYVFLDNALLESVSLPDSLKTIHNGAFSGCTALTAIDIPDSVTVLGNNVFQNCTALKEASLPKNVTTVSSYLFFNCQSLTSIEIPERATYIGYRAFDCCSSLQRAVLHEGVRNIDQWAFGSCTQLTDVVIPQSVQGFGMDPFGNCPNLVLTVHYRSFAHSWCDSKGLPRRFVPSLPENFTFAYAHDNSYAAVRQYVGTDSLVIVPFELDGVPVRGIEPDAFRNTAVATVILQDSIEYIGDKAFYGCEALSHIELGKGLTLIREHAFYGCSALTALELPSSLEELLPEALALIGGLENISIPADNPHFMTSGGALYSKDGTQLIAYPIGRDAASAVVPEGVETIGQCAFMGCGVLSEVSFPRTLTAIGADAFSGCKKLTVVTVPEGVKTVGAGAFRSCAGMTEIILPENLEDLGTSAFAFCSSLKSIELPDGLTEVKDETFRECSGLESVVLPASLTHIAENAFDSCPLVRAAVEEGSYAHGWCAANGVSFDLAE